MPRLGCPLWVLSDRVRKMLRIEPGGILPPCGLPGVGEGKQYIHHGLPYTPSGAPLLSVLLCPGLPLGVGNLQDNNELSLPGMH